MPPIVVRRLPRMIPFRITAKSEIVKVEVKTVAVLTTDLATLAEKINYELDEMTRIARTGLEHARIAGEHLTAAKKMVARGDWQQWLVIRQSKIDGSLVPF